MSSKISIGMNIHRWGKPWYGYPKEMLEHNLNSCKELGIGLIRYNNSVRDDENVEAARYVADKVHGMNMEFMLVVDDPRWKKSDDTGKIENLEKYYEDYMYRVSSQLKGKVDIYQIFNEMDVSAMRGDIANIILPGKDGREKGEYDSVMWERAMVAVTGALKGIKRGDPKAKTSINFAWWHTAMLYEMYSRGCRFDIIGIDWYSDCEEVSSFDLIVDDIKKNIPESDIMICETNYWMHPMSRDPIEKQEALKVKENRDAGQAKWVPEFIQKVIDMNEPKVKSIIFYELLDEPRCEIKKGSYNGESHFGFIECDVNGGNQVKKPAFFTLQQKIKEIKNI